MRGGARNPESQVCLAALQADDDVASHLASACSRSHLQQDAFAALAQTFPGCKLLRCAGGRALLLHQQRLQARLRPRERAMAAPLGSRLWPPPPPLPLAAAAAAHPCCLLRAPLRCRRLSFGLQNKVMITVSLDLRGEGALQTSYVPIHPTAAAASVLQNNPVVVVRQPGK